MILTRGGGGEGQEEISEGGTAREETSEGGTLKEGGDNQKRSEVEGGSEEEEGELIQDRTRLGGDS